MTRKTYCGNLLWQSSLTLSAPGLADKAVRIRQAVVKSPGRLPVFLEIVNPDGTQVEVDLGQAARVAVSVGFLSELAKIVPQADTSFRPSDKVYLDPPERKPWEQ